MPYLPLPKLLDKYFYTEQIEKMLREIHEVPTSNKNDSIKLLIKEWPLRGKDNYDFIKKLSTPQIREICKTYGINSQGKKNELLKHIKKAKLLENDKKRLTIGIGGGTGAFAVFIILISVFDFGVGAFDFIESHWNPFSDSNQTEFSDISTDQSQYFLAVAMQTIENLERYMDRLEKEILEADDEMERRKLEQIQERIELGNFHYKDGNYKNAHDYYKQALDDDPNNPESLDGYALMLAVLDELEESIKQYDKLLVIKPGYYVAMLNNAWSHILLGNYPKALELLDDLESRNSEDPFVISHKCWLMEKMNDLTQTINYCKKALDNDKDDIRAIKAYSLTLSIKGNYTQALPYHERLYNMEPDDIATIINYAITLSRTGNVQLTLDLYNDLLDEYPNLPIAKHNKRALCLAHPELVCGTV